MEHFSPEEEQRLNEILSLRVAPYIKEGSRATLELSLEELETDWLFQSYFDLPEDAQGEVEEIRSDEVSKNDKVNLLNEYLGERQYSFAPKWWELNFFDFDVPSLFELIIDRCRAHFEDEDRRSNFDSLIDSYVKLEQALHTMREVKCNKESFSEADVAEAKCVVDVSYPFDFSDYNEAPRKARGPLDFLQQLIASEISDVAAVSTKRWFEFSILNEIADFIRYFHEGERGSEIYLKKEITQRRYMFRKAISLGRMIEHYRWKFSYEHIARKGISAIKADEARGKRGADSSMGLKQKKLHLLMEEIEKLSCHFPDIGEDAIFEQAYRNANDQIEMPKTLKTKQEYGVILRSDEPFRSRYNAVFRKKA